MSNIKLTTKTSDLHSFAGDQLTNGTSPTVPAKNAKSRLLRTKRSPRPQQASPSTKRSRTARVRQQAGCRDPDASAAKRRKHQRHYR